MKLRSYIALAVLSALASGCQQNDNYDIYGAKNRLSVSVQEIVNEQWSTKSRATTQVEPADTLWLNDSIYVEAIVDDIAAPHAPATRATPITDSKQITTMSIVMFNTGASLWSTSSVQETTEGRSPMKASIVNGSYSTTPVYQWIEGDQAYRTLIAMSPYHTTSGFTLSSSGQTLAVTVPSDVAQHQDLCVSNIAKNKDVKNVIGSNNNLQKFEMSHVMTAVGFEAAGYDLSLTSVKLIGLNSKATLTLHNCTWSTPNTPITFEAKIKPNEWLTSEHIQSSSPWRDITPADGYLMMLPQVHTDNMKIEFTFTGRNNQPGGTYTMLLNQIKASGAATSDWKPGMKVTYRLRLKTRPAVQNDKVIILDANTGTVSPSLNIVTSTDDDLTFTWTASWLGMYRGATTIVSSPESNGFFTPFTTGVNNWANVKFFARSINYSTVADRVATVTVTGKKSGQHTFTVVHPKLIPLSINPTSPGVLVPGAGAKYTVNVTAGSPISWTTSPDAVVTVSPASGKGNGSVTITVAPNKSTVSRRNIKVDFITDGVVKATWSATQDIAPQYIIINNLKWTIGNLVADGSNGCKIGASTDCGLYFNCGSLIGWEGGANGDGTGAVIQKVGKSIRVKPSAYTGPTTWPSPGIIGRDVPQSYNAAAGTGDPCRYYLGSTWRLPTYNEFRQLFSNCPENGGWGTCPTGAWQESPIRGSWGGPGAKSANANNSIFFPASGLFDYMYGVTYIYDVLYWSSTKYGSDTNYTLSQWVYSAYMGGGSAWDKNTATPIRCVQPL